MTYIPAVDTWPAIAEDAQQLYEDGRDQAALILWREVARQRSNRFGPSHPSTLSALHSTIYVLVRLAKYSDALPLCEHLAETRVRTLGSEHESTADAAAWLAYVRGRVSQQGEPHARNEEAPAAGHVFMSYVTEDTPSVVRLAGDLRAGGVEVWRDRERLLPGMRWQAAIRKAIEEGTFFLACFSAHTTRRGRSYMNEELSIAIDELRKRPTDRTWFLPVLLSQCVMPDRSIGAGQSLHDIQYVALYEHWDEGVRLLTTVIDP